MSARDEARTALANELAKIEIGSGYESVTFGATAAREAADALLVAFPRLATLLDQPVPAAPWDGRGCFGHCDKEGWYSECVSKPAAEPVPADEREAPEPPTPISDAVRDMAFSTYTCAWCAVQPMAGTARDVDGTVLPSCGQEGHGTP